VGTVVALFWLVPLHALVVVVPLVAFVALVGLVALVALVALVRIDEFRANQPIQHTQPRPGVVRAENGLQLLQALVLALVEYDNETDGWYGDVDLVQQLKIW